ncbi:MAG: MlaD family protein [bacterium]
MKNTASSPWSGLRVGIVLVAAIAVALWASLTGGGTSIFNPKAEFKCYFRNVNGLLGGSPVWMSGVEVGNVRSVHFVNLDSLRKVEVTCKIQTSVWDMVTVGTEVQLGTIGLLGDKFVEVIPGPVGGPVIAEGSMIPVRDVGSAEAMFKEGTEALEQAGSVAQNLDGVLGRMNRGEGTLGQLATNDSLYVQMSTLLARLTELTTALVRNQERLTSSVEHTATSVGSLADKVENNIGTLGKLIGDPALYDNLSATSAKLDTIIERINRADGSLGMFVSDTSFYTETVNLLQRVNNLVLDIEQNPRKYLKFSVF